MTKILGFSEDGSKIYYQAAPYEKPSQRHLYVTETGLATNVSDTESETVSPNFMISKCLTCSLQQSQCKFYDGSMSTNGSFYLRRCLGPGIPFSEVRATKLNTKMATLITNADIRTVLEHMKLPLYETLQFPIKDTKYCKCLSTNSLKVTFYFNS